MSISTISRTRPGRGLITQTRVGEQDRLVDVVRDERVVRRWRSQIGQEALRAGARLGVERPERLVHEQHLGSLASARAIATRCFMPPESSFG